jgi:hypothetical protein
MGVVNLKNSTSIKIIANNIKEEIRQMINYNNYFAINVSINQKEILNRFII